VRVHDRWTGARVRVTDPLRKQHDVDLHRSGDFAVGALTDPRVPGYYTVSVTPPRRPAATADPVHLGFAVNLDLGTASLRSLDETGLRETFGVTRNTCKTLARHAIIVQLHAKQAPLRQIAAFGLPN